MIDRTATARLQRLVRWLEHFKPCFGHRAQVLSLRQYVQGVFSRAERKSMHAMLARVTAPTSYQAFQHFITHAPWDAARVWRRLRAVIPERTGVAVLDGTTVPKHGTASVGVARQYCGTLGKIANCQAAVTLALWTGVRAWLLGAALYLPRGWMTLARRRQVRIPSTVRFEEKWRLAVRLLRQARAAGFHVTGVVADAEFGDVSAFRTLLHRWRLPYALGISANTTVFVGQPRLHAPLARTGGGRPRTRFTLPPGTSAQQVQRVARGLPARAWRVITWRNGLQRPWRARFAAVRVTPAHDWRCGRLAPAVWLLCERGLPPSRRVRYYVVHLPPTVGLRALVRFAHQRWAIEQQYRDLKTGLGLDHFEGRSYPGWHHHVALTAVAYTYLQNERRRARGESPLTFPAICAIVQEIFTALLFASRPRYMAWMRKVQAGFQLRL